MTGDHVFEPDATRAMALAFDGLCGSLQLPNDAIASRQLIATRVIELASDGELNPAIIYGRILHEHLSREAIRLRRRARVRG